MNYSDLQTQVQNNVIDLPPKVQAAIPNLINEAIRTAQRKYNFRAMEGSASFVTTVGTLSPTPNTIAQFKEYKDKGPYLLRNLVESKYYVTTTADNAALAALINITQPVEPRYLTNTVDPITGAYTFSVAPYPDALSDWPDGNYRIIVPYYFYSAPLVNSGDSNWFTLNMDDYIWRQATGLAFQLDWDYNSMAVWLQQAEVKRKEAVDADKRSRLAGVDAWVPLWQGANQPAVRR